jgi:hypothetical protein
MASEMKLLPFPRPPIKNILTSMHLLSILFLSRTLIGTAHVIYSQRK